MYNSTCKAHPGGRSMVTTAPAPNLAKAPLWAGWISQRYLVGMIRKAFNEQ